MSDYAMAMWWRAMLDKGPICFLKEDWSRVEHSLDGASRVIFKQLLAGMDQQTRWIDERTRAMRDEAERVATIGATMKRAGLRSYTDEKGRIFVAGDRDE